jgi:hypothetical protein
MSRSFWGSGSSWAGAFLAIAAVSGGLAACNKSEPKKESSAKKAAPQKDKDRYADGKRLEQELAQWAKRWEGAPALPPCQGVFTTPETLANCAAAETSLAALRDAVAKKQPVATIAKLTADHALASEIVLSDLRVLVAAEVAAPPVAGAATAPVKPPAPPAKPPAPSPTGSAAGKQSPNGHPGAEVTEDSPLTIALRGYTRDGRMVLRFASRLLQVAPLATRRLVASELERVSQGRKEWAGLGRALGDAARTESDSGLKAKLQELAKTFARPPRRPGMPPGHPGMRPPVPDMGHPPAAPAPTDGAKAPAATH